METVYYTPKEVAERLKLRVQTVYDYIRSGRLPAVRLGNRCRIAQSDLEAFLGRRQATGRPVQRKERLDNATPPPAAEGAVEDDLRERIEQNEAARRLLAKWLSDESGYDEEAWPVVERLLQQYPVSMGDPHAGHELPIAHDASNVARG